MNFLENMLQNVDLFFELGVRTLHLVLGNMFQIADFLNWETLFFRVMVSNAVLGPFTDF